MFLDVPCTSPYPWNPRPWMLSEGSLRTAAVGEEAPGMVWCKLRASLVAAG